MHRPNPLPTGANAIRDTALDIFRHLLRFCLDSLLIVAAFGAALLLRFDGFAPAPYPLYFVLAMPVVILIYTLALLAFGTHENLWQFAGVAELSRLWGACLTATGVLILADLASIFVTEYDIYALPVSVVVSGGVFSGVLLTGSRLWRRVLALFRQPAAPAEAAQRVLIVGAGSAGALLGRELLLHRRHAYVPVGFVDDDRAKLGKVIHGIRVLGTRDDIPALVAEHDIDVVAIAIPSRPSIVREIFRICRNTSAKVRNVPGLAEIVEGRAPVDALREITIEDLLRRDEVTLDHAAVKDYFAGRTILVTGAAGSIGSELCRQLIAFEPKQLVLLDFNESDLFTLEQELLAQTEPERVLGLIADVTNAERLGAAIRRFAPEVIFHAAAYKHVDMMEKHPEEALRVNVLGTDNLCRAADGIARQVVLISSDKAVHPKSVMGCSKRLAEQIIADWAGRSTTRYCAVRFGNVLGSRGSVIPQFKAQIERGGPLEVRNPNATRYFMYPRGLPARDPGGGAGRGRQPLRARHGRTGAHRRPGRGHDPPLGAARGRGHRNPRGRAAAGREAARGALQPGRAGDAQPDQPRQDLHCLDCADGSGGTARVPGRAARRTGPAQRRAGAPPPRRSDRRVPNGSGP